MKDKRGIGILLTFFMTIGVMMFLGILLGLSASIIDWGFDEIVPEVTNIGQVGNANVSKIAGYGVDPVNSFVQQFTWLTGVAYVLGFVLIFGMAFWFRGSQEKWMLPLFFAMAVLIIIVSMFVSNIYEDFYNDTSDTTLSSRLQDQALLSYMIIYSPVIMTFVIFIAGIILFGGANNEAIF